MNEYEMVIIVNPDMEETEQASLIDGLNKIIVDNKGTIEETKQWGKKKLAYPIEGFTEGSYVVTQFKMESQSVKELEESVKNTGNVLRSLVVKK
jgi:small subunit ribosomal protein S6